MDKGRISLQLELNFCGVKRKSGGEEQDQRKSKRNRKESFEETKRDRATLETADESVSTD